MVLKGADAVVFVADSQAALMDANLESLENLRGNLIANGLDPGLPMVLQYNKRDLATALPVAILNARLNPEGRPFHEATAVQGIGVEETLKTAAKLIFKSLSDLYGREAPPPPGTRRRSTDRSPRLPEQPGPRRRSTDRSLQQELAEPELPRATPGPDQWVYLR